MIYSGEAFIHKACLNHVRYLGIYLDEYVNWSPHINHLSQKLVKVNAMLCILWHFVNVATIKSISYAIFHSHLSYLCTALSRKSNTQEQSTRSASHCLLTKTSCSTSKYGINAFAASAIKSWSLF